jgi:hypothetical protein
MPILNPWISPELTPIIYDPSGIALPQRKKIQFVSNVCTITDNALTQTTDVVFKSQVIESVVTQTLDIEFTGTITPDGWELSTLILIDVQQPDSHITGIASEAPNAGVVLHKYLINVGDEAISLDNDADGAPYNFLIPSDVGDYTLGAGYAVRIWYDVAVSKWRLLIS